MLHLFLFGLFTGVVCFLSYKVSHDTLTLQLDMFL